jgi:hypothetical protein
MVPLWPCLAAPTNPLTRLGELEKARKQQPAPAAKRMFDGGAGGCKKRGSLRRSVVGSRGIIRRGLVRNGGLVNRRLVNRGLVNRRRVRRRRLLDRRCFRAAGRRKESKNAQHKKLLHYAISRFSLQALDGADHRAVARQPTRSLCPVSIEGPVHGFTATVIGGPRMLHIPTSVLWSRGSGPRVDEVTQSHRAGSTRCDRRALRRTRSVCSGCLPE